MKRFPDECSVNDIENEIQSKVSAEMIPRYNAGYSKQLYEKSQMVRDKRLVSILKNKGIVSKYDYVSIHLCDIREAIDNLRLSELSDYNLHSETIYWAIAGAPHPKKKS